MDCWTFNPCYPEQWNQSKNRILFVAAEPNGNQPTGSVLDMGHWFRTASIENGFHGNKGFFTRCVIMLDGINRSNNMSEKLFSNFRYIDLKATSGAGIVNQDTIDDYVKANLDFVTKYFNSSDESFGLRPHIIVLLGNKAQNTFNSQIKTRIIGQKKLRWICMPHPSHTVAYEALKSASEKIEEYLRPIDQTAHKWVYEKGNSNNWKLT